MLGAAFVALLEAAAQVCLADLLDVALDRAVDEPAAVTRG
jgi:hypothetical protein